MTRRQKIEAVRNERCRRCTLHRSSQNVCVMGRGNPRAKLMLLGEAPGAAEAKTGKPFMGQAGKLLDRILDAIGLDRDAYISNLARCRPPDNRTPTKREISLCHSYLRDEREIVRPKLVVIMGKTVAKRAGLATPERLHGAIFDWCWTPTMITVHPAYCLPGRGGEKAKEVLVEALKRGGREVGL